ncbi:TPA: hypothetical protein ACH3X3_001886 [Trebouxia sp. C0006]
MQQAPPQEPVLPVQADISELRQAVPLELGCMAATHLSSMACKVSSAASPGVGIGRRRGRQARLSDHQLMAVCPKPTTQVTDDAGPTVDVASTRGCLAELARALGPSKPWRDPKR